MKREKISGIYIITNEITRKQYVGQSVDIYKRWRDHQRELDNGTHINPVLLHSYQKHGRGAFTFEIIERCPIKSLNKREMYWIRELNTVSPHGYNLTFGGDGNLGWKPPDSVYDVSRKPVVLLNSMKYYPSLTAAQNDIGINACGIALACRDITSYAGKIDGEPLLWAWKTEVDNCQDIHAFLERKLCKVSSILRKEYMDGTCKKIVCLNNQLVFNSISDATKWYGFKSLACVWRAIQPGGKSAGCDENGCSYVWRYYDDYIKMSPDEIRAAIQYANTPVDNNRKQPVVCLNNQKQYASISEAARDLNCRASSIVSCCTGQRNGAGCCPETCQKYAFAYQSDYLTMTEEEIQRKIHKANTREHLRGANATNKKPVFCTTTNFYFSCTKEAGNAYGVAPSQITAVCRGKGNYAGRHPITNEPLKWRYAIPSDRNIVA